jgi:hypothetical protein
LSQTVGVGHARLVAAALGAAFFVAGASTAARPLALVPPTVVPSRTGFVQRTTGGQTWLNYAVELRNKSTDIDAVEVTVDLRFRTARRLVTRDTQQVTIIPKGATSYLAGEIRWPGKVKFASIRALISVARGAKSGLTLIRARNVAVKKTSLGGWKVTGVITNHYDVSLSYDSSACAVVLDSSGRLIGGSCTPLGYAFDGERLASHATGKIELSLNSFPGAARRVVSTRVSIDPGVGVLPESLRKNG